MIWIWDLFGNLNFRGVGTCNNLLAVFFITFFNQCSPQKDTHHLDYPYLFNSNNHKIQLYQNADQLKYSGKFQASRDLFVQLWTNKKQQLSAEDRYYCLNQLAYLELCLHHDTEAKTWIDTIGKFFPNKVPLEKGDYFYNYGLWSYRTDRIATARTYLHQALKLYQNTYRGDHLKVASCKNTIGMMYVEYSIDSSYTYIEEANNFFHNYRSLERFSYENMLAMAQLCRFDDEYERGEEFCNKAIEHSKKVKDAVCEGRANSLKGYMIRKKIGGKLDAIRDTTERKKIKKQLLEKAEVCHIESIKILNEQKSLFLQEAMNFYAYYFNALGDSTKFYNFLKKCEPVAKGKEKYMFLDLLLGYYQENKNSDNAIRHYESFLHKFETNRICPKWFIEHAFYSLSLLYVEKGEFLKALDCVRKDLVFGTKYENIGNDWKKLQRHEICYAKNYQFTDYHLAAGIFLAKYKKDSLERDLRQAYALYKLADTLLFNQIVTYDENAILTKLKREGDPMYSGAIETVYLLHKKYPHNKHYLNDALHFMEKRKAYLLMENQKWRKIDRPTPKLRKAFTKLKELEVMLSKNGNANLDDQLSLNYKKDSLLQYLKKVHPEYRTRESRGIPTIEDLKKLLQPNQTLLDFYIADSTIYSLVVDASTQAPKFYAKPIAKDTIKAQIDSLNKLIYGSKHMWNEDYIPVSHKAKYISLSSTLIKVLLNDLNFKKTTNELIIIPHDVIYSTPFDALICPDKKLNVRSKFKDMTFLVERYNVSFSPSLRLFKQNFDKPIQTKCGKYLALGISEFEFQINTFKKYFSRAKSVMNTIDERSFFGQCKNKDIVHISLHGNADLENHAALRLPKQDTIFDYELMHLEFSKNTLVILAACETGKGNYSYSEGMYSISWYFIQAGAVRTVAAQPNINPKVVDSILNVFYAKLAEGNSVETSLWEAKKKFLANPEVEADTNPFFWSGLVCIR